MNRKDLRAIARIRLREARVLLREGLYSGAYYLTGYAAECGLKACIAKLTRMHDFPDKERGNKCFTHDLVALVRLASLDASLRAEMAADRVFELNWSLVRDWNEQSRYETRSKRQAEDIFSAAANRQHGVMRWVRRHW